MGVGTWNVELTCALSEGGARIKTVSPAARRPSLSALISTFQSPTPILINIVALAQHGSWELGVGSWEFTCALSEGGARRNTCSAPLAWEDRWRPASRSCALGSMAPSR